MPLTIYKSTDVGAPVMNSSAGSLLAVLDACLVNGYGSKAAAGWSKTVIDAPTYQAVYTQGAAAGLPQKKLYVKDDASTVGTANVWACDACTVAASPVLTNYFWTYETSYIGVLTKANQETPQFSKWMIVATDRWVYIFTKRSAWGSRGWAMSFVGDLDTPYPADKGKFAVTGFTTHDGTLPLNAGCRVMSSGYIGVYGHQDGTYKVNRYGYKRAMGDYSGYADATVPKSVYSSGLLLSRILVADTLRYRGALPQIYRTVVSLDNFSWYMLPDEYVIQNADASKSYLHIQFGGTLTGTTEPGRVFIDITGAL